MTLRVQGAPGGPGPSKTEAAGCRDEAPEIYLWVPPALPLPPRAGSVDDLKQMSLGPARLWERTRRGASGHPSVQQDPRSPRSKHCQVERPGHFPFPSLQPDWGGREIKKCFCGNNHREALSSTFID